MENITHPDLVAALVKPGDIIKDQLTAGEAHLWHMATGIAGEAGEIMESVLDSLRHSKLINVPNVIEEQGDMEFYLEGARKFFGLTRESVAIALNPPTPLISLSLGIVTQNTMALVEAAEIGMVASQILDAVKKIVIYRKPADLPAIMEALARMDWHLERFRNFFGLTREQCLAANIQKLSVRYNGIKYSDDAAQARADKK